MSANGRFLIKSNGPYNFVSSSAFYRRSRFEIDDRFDDNLFVRTFRHENYPILIKIDANKNKGRNSLLIKWFSPLSKIDTRGLRHHLAKIFYLDFPLKDFYNHRLGNVLGKLIKKYPGFRPIMAPSAFEAAAWSIIGQQVNLAFAYSLKKRLIKAVNRKFVIDRQHYYLFPEPGDVAKFRYNELQAMQFSRRKAEYLIDFARMVDSGKIDLDHLGTLDYEYAVEKLLMIRGIGPWSANYILLRGTGHCDAFPIGDSGLNQAIRRLYNLTQAPKPKFLAELSEKWRPYRSLATYYLWKSLQEDI